MGRDGAELEVLSKETKPRDIGEVASCDLPAVTTRCPPPSLHSCRDSRLPQVSRSQPSLVDVHWPGAPAENSTMHVGSLGCEQVNVCFLIPPELGAKSQGANM